MDISDAIKAKSDQLNAADLMGGPVTVQIEATKRGNRDQPVIVHVTGGHMPWKPSKTALRALAHFWGTDTTKWEGRWVRLYRDPRTLWAGKPVGGIMVSGLSDFARGGVSGRSQGSGCGRKCGDECLFHVSSSFFLAARKSRISSVFFSSIET